MRACSYIILFVCGLSVLASVAQQDAAPLPAVTNFECPKYPPKAESTRLQGMVKLQVTTDGHRASDVKLTSGHPVLAEAAEKNVRTWIFADHTPTAFLVTYFYLNEGKFKRDAATKCDAKMELPTKVTVSTRFAFP